MASPILQSFFLTPTHKLQSPVFLFPKKTISFTLVRSSSSSSSSSSSPSPSTYPYDYPQEERERIDPNTRRTLEMVRNRQGVWSVKQKKVVVLWDLDNKPPKGPPYQAAMSLRSFAGRFGEVVDVSAYANRHAFVHVPGWVAEQRQERRALDVLERKGLAVPDEPYVCGVCGRKCRTNVDLRKHFRQLHERERQKKVARMQSLKGKKRRQYRERFISGNRKYEAAAREILKPKLGYGLAGELRRAGVFVKTVEDKPQAADWALKRQMMHVMNRGVDCLFLVSDDSDFREMLRRARESDLQTVVVGDGRALSGHADVWVSWNAVEFGEVGEEFGELVLGSVQKGLESDGLSISFLDEDDEDEDEEDDDDDDDDDDDFRGFQISVFSEGEDVHRDSDDGGEEADFFL